MNLNKLNWNVNVALDSNNVPYEYRKRNGKLVARPLFIREGNHKIEYYRVKQENKYSVLVIRKSDRKVLYHTTGAQSEFVVLGRSCFAVMQRLGGLVDGSLVKMISVENPEIVEQIPRCTCVGSSWISCSDPYIRNRVLWLNGRYFFFDENNIIREISKKEFDRLNLEDRESGWEDAELF